VLHTTGGYLAQAAFTHRTVFDLKPDTDVYWCTADVGWITGHTYLAYAPLVNAATQVMYEGTPDTPDWSRWWRIVERYGVTILYTAPTAIRAAMKVGRQVPQGHDLSSLRVLGSVGEPINPEAWLWYREIIGGGRAPIVDTWWQTETGAIMASPLPGVTTLKPGSAQRPVPGVSLAVVDDSGRPVPAGEGGLLVADRPWPSMLRGVWDDEQRYRDTYWSVFGDRYFAGDGARLDEDGDLWLLGRVDDVMNVSGHRLSTAEIESALVAHHAVAEAAVGRRAGPGHRAGGRRVRGAQAQPAPGRAAGRSGRAACARRRDDRRDRPSEGRARGARSAEDPVGQDHPTGARRARIRCGGGGPDDRLRPVRDRHDPGDHRRRRVSGDRVRGQAKGMRA
jgi:acetyl-CoA synthetase